MKKSTFLRGISSWAVFGPLVLVLLVALGPVPASAQDSGQEATKDLVLTGDAKCTRCHDAEDSPEVLSIGLTKHGTTADGRTPTCTTCHGDSEEHIATPKTVWPEHVFSKKSTMTGADRSAICLTCHSGHERMFWDNGTHAARGVSCDSCHQVHNGGHDKVREKTTEAEVCFTCHKAQRVAASKHSRHPIIEGKVTCSDCHNPHGSAGASNLKRDTVNDTCFQCHAEKRGPFIWNHQPVTENCSYCHDPHGTNTASLLKWRSPFLCQQCHEPGGSHRGSAPGFSIDTSSTSGNNILFARGCLNCHTLIHGSNNSSNSSNARAFFR
jgi:DmsE family decaheme c-type cytochrome